MRALVRAESWPIRGGFRIARGARSNAEVLVVELDDGEAVGRAECVPYTRYDESIESVREAIESAVAALPEVGARRTDLQSLPAGAARNAIDCALWDLEARATETPAWALAGLRREPAPVSTMRTVSVGTPEEMHVAAASVSSAAVIKVKVDGGPDLERIEAVHAAAPQAELVVDANEAWSVEQCKAWLPDLPRFGVSLLEQPLPAGRDAALEALEHPIPICADESFHDRRSFETARGRYELVNIKLDKAGGLTEALACASEAERLGLRILLGCMVSTSLAIEPALLLADRATYVDLDGPLLLENDREGAKHDRLASVLRPSGTIWGGA